MSLPAHLPKAELHLHLDCSLSYAVVKRILPSLTEAEFRENYIAPAKCGNLADYLSRTFTPIAIMQTPEQLEWVVDDLFQQLAADHVMYAEIRFAPLQHLEKGLTPYEVVRITEAATAKAVKAYGVEARLILCTLRHFSVQQSMETVQLVNAFKNSYVAGFDIAADEAGFPIDNHIAAFQYARKNAIPCTAHAGEARGPESVWETLEHFKPSRIGHGVRSIEDEKLVQHLKENRIHLEICPHCNVQINIYDTLQHHPIDKLYRAGVSLNVNTDGRTLTDTSLGKEYAALHEIFGWTAADFYTCNVNALRAAFIPENVKEALLQKLQLGYAGYLTANA